MGKISKENWELSRDKHIEIKKRLEEGRPFDDRWGWHDLIVNHNCGYCVEFSCHCCNLHDRNICSDDSYRSRRPFWQLMKVMCTVRFDIVVGGYTVSTFTPKKNPDFKKALIYQEKILTAIMADENNTY